MRKTYNKKTSRRTSGYKKTRRRRRTDSRKLIFTIIGVLIFAGLSGIGATYIASKSASVNMEVSGIDDKSSIKPEELKKAAHETFNLSFSFMGAKFEAQNFLSSNQKKMENLMAKFPQIENIEMKRNNDGSIVFEVKEKTPFAIWCENDKCSLVDKQGLYIRDCSDDADYGDLPKISGKEDSNDDGYKEKIMNSVSEINEVISTNEHFKKQSYEIFPDKMIVRGDIQCELIFNPDENISWQLEKMEIILKNEEYIENLSSYQYIDLRFRNQAIIK
ncbi:hypothetical protein M0R01_02305 [bacterium]|nr:hypothetical protein [bacterium]